MNLSEKEQLLGKDSGHVQMNSISLAFWPVFIFQSNPQDRAECQRKMKEISCDGFKLSSSEPWASSTPQGLQQQPKGGWESSMAQACPIPIQFYLHHWKCKGHCFNRKTCSLTHRSWSWVPSLVHDGGVVVLASCLLRSDLAFPFWGIELQNTPHKQNQVFQRFITGTGIDQVVRTPEEGTQDFY